MFMDYVNKCDDDESTQTKFIEEVMRVLMKADINKVKLTYNIIQNFIDDIHLSVSLVGNLLPYSNKREWCQENHTIYEFMTITFIAVYLDNCVNHGITAHPFLVNYLKEKGFTV